MPSLVTSQKERDSNNEHMLMMSIMIKPLVTKSVRHRALPMASAVMHVRPPCWYLLLPTETQVTRAENFDLALLYSALEMVSKELQLFRECSQGNS